MNINLVNFVRLMSYNDIIYRIWSRNIDTSTKIKKCLGLWNLFQISKGKY